MNFKNVYNRLRKDGWIIKEQKGGHVQMIHPERPGKITIPKHGKKDIKPGTLNAIWWQAGLK